MNKTKEILAQIIDSEYKKINEHLCQKVGKSTVKKINASLDEQMTIAVEREFKNFVNYKTERR